MSNHPQLLIRWPSRQQWEDLKQLDQDNHWHTIEKQLEKKNEVAVLLHPKDVSAFLGPTSLKKNKSFAQATAFAIEPHVLDDIDDLYITEHAFSNTPGNDTSINQTLITVVRRDWITTILKSLNTQGVRVKAFIIEPLLYSPPLPTNHLAVWLIHRSDHVWICSNKSAPWAFLFNENNEKNTQPKKPSKQENLKTQFWQRLNQWAEQNQLDLNNGLTVFTEKINFLDIWLNTKSEVPVKVLDNQAMVLFKKTKSVVPADELQKQNPQRKKHPSHGFNELVSARLAICASAFCIVALNLKAWQLEREALALDQTIELAVSNALPNTPLVVDPLLMLESAHHKLNNKNNAQKATWTQFLHNSAMALSNLPFNATASMRYEKNTLHIEFSTNLGEDLKQAAVAALKTYQLAGQWHNNTTANAVLSITPTPESHMQ